MALYLMFIFLVLFFTFTLFKPLNFYKKNVGINIFIWDLILNIVLIIFLISTSFISNLFGIRDMPTCDILLDRALVTLQLFHSLFNYSNY
jgi:hypothetical protein